jgi:glycosyltransferase involved in cell wall biosynthesis
MQRLVGCYEATNDATNIVPPRWAAMINTLLDKFYLSGIFETLMLIIYNFKVKSNVIILADEPIGFDFFSLIFLKLLFRKAKIYIDINDLIVRLGAYPNYPSRTLRGRIGILLNETVIPKLANGIIVLTKFAYCYFRDRVKKIFILPEYVNVENYKSSNIDSKFIEDYYKLNREKIKIIWVGNLFARHLPGLLLLFKALIKFKDRYQLIIVGDGPYLDFCKRFAMRLGLDVIFTGRIAPLSKELIILLKASDVGFVTGPNRLFMHFITTSKLSQYMAAGLVILAPKLYGIKELINNELLYENDESDLMKRLELLLDMNLDILKENSKRIAEEKLSAKAFSQVIDKFIDFLLN